jgi:hypothetical protein
VRIRKVSDSISDFKMFEKTPYEQPDIRAITELVMRGVKEEEKVYGPAFTAKLISYALRLLSKYSGEAPPEDIKTLEQLTEYLLTKKDKFPPHWALLWAQFVTEKKLEGARGAGTRFMNMGITKRVLESDGDVRLKKIDIDHVLKTLHKTIVDMKVAPLEMGYKKNEDRSIDILYRNCYFSDACKLASEEGLLKRQDGRMACSIFGLVCHYLKIGTDYEWDYAITKFEKPICIAKCSMIQ